MAGMNTSGEKALLSVKEFMRILESDRRKQESFSVIRKMVLP